MSTVRDLEAYRFHERDWAGYDDLYGSFEHEVPDRFNMADYVCDRWATDKGRVALFFENDAGEERTYTFRRLRNLANRLANYLESRGVGRGDRIGVNTPQKPETLIAHVAAWKLGAVTVPLSTLYGPDGIEYRLSDCGAEACVVDSSNLDAYRAVKDSLPVSTTITLDEPGPAADEVDFEDALDGASRERETAATAAEDDAMIFYTSGTTGDPKGVRHAHRLLLGSLPMFVTSTCDLEMNPGDLHWNVAEFAWMGSLYTTVFPSLYYGAPVLAYHDEGTFDAERTYALIEKYGVTNFFAPPTGLRMMMQVSDVENYEVDSVRTVVSGGAAVGRSVVDWASDTFDEAKVHTVYGQTEAPFVVGHCTSLFDFREGTMGRAVPGHEVRLVDPETGDPIPPGEPGEIAIRYEGDPVCLKEYWNRPEKTREKIEGGWLLTDDLAERDTDGYFTFVGRKDDVIISSGYRIGPEEVEDSLATHEAVVEAGVIGVPDDLRGEVPKAFVVLGEGYEPSGALEEALKDHVGDRLAKYEYPREVEFVDELPKTATGKIRRVELREREDGGR